MHKIIFSVFAMALSISSIAQTFIYPGGSKMDCEITTGFNEYNMVFSTQLPEAITYSWEMIENTVPEDWDYSLCDYTTCYIGIPASSDMRRISLEESKNGQQGFLKFNVLTTESNGNYVFKFYVYDSMDHDRGDTVIFNFSNSTVSVSDVKKISPVTLYPNPTTGSVYVETLEGDSEVEIFDISGKVIKEEKLQFSGVNEIDLNGIRSGIYRIVVRSGSLVQSSSLVVNE
ncbi:MAG: hypothetical protein ACI8SE_000255 [Bacteroidia bacterium]|jgi:hypothetical protein